MHVNGLSPVQVRHIHLLRLALFINFSSSLTHAHNSTECLSNCSKLFMKWIGSSVALPITVPCYRVCALEHLPLEFLVFRLHVQSRDGFLWIWERTPLCLLCAFGQRETGLKQAFETCLFRLNCPFGPPLTLLSSFGPLHNKKKKKEKKKKKCK